MKIKALRTIDIIIYAVSITCCSPEFSFEEQHNNSITTSPVQNSSNNVSKAAITQFVSLKRGAPTKSISESDIESLVVEGDTVAYIINNSEGWEMISADTRTPALLAHSDKGSWNNMENPAVKDWIMSMAHEMHSIINTPDSLLTFSKDEILANKALWDGISFPVDTFDTGDYHDGYYAPYHIEATVTPYDEVVHLTNTRWHQGIPYNSYCPIINGTNAAAGCVAIAGAQMMYYLHHAIGVPNGMINSPEDIGNINAPHSNSVWDRMHPEFNLTEAGAETLLISHIGHLIGTNYGVERSGASWRNLVDDVFSPYGISCYNGSYNASRVSANLLSGMPVIVHSNNNNLQGHTFLIDGYYRDRQITTITYRWSHGTDRDGNELFDNSTYPDTFSVIQGTPSIVRIYMNWGWWSQWYIWPGHTQSYLNNTWFALTGDWTTVDYNGDETTYGSFMRTMISDFSANPDN